jgi:hypothetical protein
MFYPVAKEMAKGSGTEFRVVQFINRIDITEETRGRYK